MTDRPHIFRGMANFFTDQIAPDLLGLLEDGIEYRRLLDRRTRREARDAVERFRRIVWGEILVDNADDSTDDDNEPVDALFVTVAELARRAGTDASYVRRLCRRGVLTSRKLRGRHYIERDGADAWLARTRN
jgi:hypothetical protein